MKETHLFQVTVDSGKEEKTLLYSKLATNAFPKTENIVDQVELRG